MKYIAEQRRRRRRQNERSSLGRHFKLSDEKPAGENGKSISCVSVVKREIEKRKTSYNEQKVSAALSSLFSSLGYIVQCFYIYIRALCSCEIIEEKLLALQSALGFLPQRHQRHDAAALRKGGDILYHHAAEVYTLLSS